MSLLFNLIIIAIMNLVSVIIPCYNYGHFIGQTIESLFKQSHKDWEAIIIDDGSSDNTKEVVAEYIKRDTRVKYVYQENQGLPSARNTGIEQAKGAFIQFLDSDDLLQINKLKEQVAYLKKHQKVDIVYSGLRYFYDNTPEVLHHTINGKNHSWHLQKSGAGLQLAPFLIISCVIMPPMPMLRREVMLTKVGLFTKDLPSCEDWEFWIRCTLANLTIHYLEISQTLSLMRIHGTSMTQNRIVMVPSFIEVRNRLKNILPNEHLKALNERLLVNDWIEMSILKKQTEGLSKGLNYLSDRKQEKPSFKLRIWQLILIITTSNLALKLLSLNRSLVKKTYYLRNK